MDFGTLYSKARSRALLGAVRRRVGAITRMEPAMQALSDDALRARFQALAAVALSERVVEGFALVREASRRVLGLRQFDVQLMGGLVLLNGQLAEMRTGEGKTLTIAAPAAVLALEGKGVHVVTANAYLAQRDAQLMGPLYRFLGLEVAALSEDMALGDKQAAYAAHVTYGVGHQFGFDYLKDNLVRSRQAQAQRPLFAAIVDEVDSILIDEARVPLIISGQAGDVSQAVRLIEQAVSGLTPGLHYSAELKNQQASLTEAGYAAVEAALAANGLIASESALYDPVNLPWVRRVHSAVRAHALFRRDRDYVVEGNELVLVDQGTGRKMPGRRFEDGLHEALEAKEHLAILPGSVTRATVTYQNFFARYQRLAGLTGTALTDADEFAEIYSLETVVIPTNRPIARVQLEDLVFANKAQKFEAVVDEIAKRHATGQPVLVGCSTIRDAEVVEQLLVRRGIPHELLTAKHLEREAHVIAQAGKPGAVTVATHMAGRGTDISLGGEKPEGEAATPEAMAQWAQARERVLKAGGLYVLGTERHGLRRVDNQLAGRSGRQGDPGEVQFMLSLEDELLRVFAKDARMGVVRRLAQNAGGALSGKQVAALVTLAQRKYEGVGFDARRALMKFDKVLAEQREAIYAQRSSLLEGGCLDYCQGLMASAVNAWVERWLPADALPEQWDLKAAKQAFSEQFDVSLPLVGWVHSEELAQHEVAERVQQMVLEAFRARQFDEQQCRDAFFDALDSLWTEHLSALDELREAANLKGHSGQNPLYQYAKEALALFEGLVVALAQEVSRRLMTAQTPAAAPAVPAAGLSEAARVAVELERRWVRRLDACPCGSGKRYKDCHGQLG